MTNSRTARGNPALRLGLIRRLHVYASVFVAPSLLFFALTGAVQTFRIPDQKAAPVVLQKLARLHKDDVFAVKPARPKPPGAREGPSAPRPAPPPTKASTTVLKWFFATVSVGIAATTSLGLWMALAYGRDRGLLWAILVAGAAAPALILAF